MSNLGERIKEAREHANLRQEDLAIILGLKSGSAVSRYESNERALSSMELTIIAKATNCNANWLLTGEGTKYPDKGIVTESRNNLESSESGEKSRGTMKDKYIEVLEENRELIKENERLRAELAKRPPRKDGSNP